MAVTRQSHLASRLLSVAEVLMGARQRILEACFVLPGLEQFPVPVSGRAHTCCGHRRVHLHPQPPCAGGASQNAPGLTLHLPAGEK